MRKLEASIAAIAYIEKHLSDEKIDLDTVSKAVHYSKYHLHRIFSDTVQLTIHDYVQRRQLTEAAKLLVFSEKPILDIALLAGYDSQQAFSYVFKAMYKQPPLEFRKSEVFYPLQLEYDFKDQPVAIGVSKTNPQRQICYATEIDIPAWIDLARLCVDGFPYLDEVEHIAALKGYIENDGALLMFEGNTVIGSMLINDETGSIDFLAVHPLHRKRGVTRDFLDAALSELIENKEISITTFRQGDKADTGYRKAIKELGFAEADLLREFGYPTQRMVLSREDLTG
ncbi:GNAT family N-acetyltransferase [Sedimentibacter sp.]|uniref:GNAT family N-acetyltransferase n=1 Tax=Sedimentibacter sp. TaxID=1960295 RepID=UPI0028A9F67E|nr:GNAT family N-acetyltransferase [Sedimentibacter sp.]